MLGELPPVVGFLNFQSQNPSLKFLSFKNSNWNVEFVFWNLLFLYGIFKTRIYNFYKQVYP